MVDFQWPNRKFAQGSCDGEIQLFNPFSLKCFTLIFLQQIFVWQNYTIHLIFGTLIPRKTRFNILVKAYLLSSLKDALKACPYIKFCIYAILQQIYIQYCCIFKLILCLLSFDTLQAFMFVCSTFFLELLLYGCCDPCFLNIYPINSYRSSLFKQS